VIAVRDHLHQLGDALVVVVSFADDPARLAAYRDHLGIDFAVLSDVDRVLYRLLGAGRGSLRRVWSPGTLALYARLLYRGRRLQVSNDDTRQLGADAVIDRDGRLRRLWLPDSPDTRPGIDQIIDAVRNLDSN
jgi:peroxiredoxin